MYVWFAFGLIRPLRGRKRIKQMTKESDYETYFKEIGLGSPQEQAIVLNFMRELFSIAINHLKGMEEKEVAYD